MLCGQLKFRKYVNVVKRRNLLSPLSIFWRWGRVIRESGLTKAVTETDNVPGYVQCCSGGCPPTSVHSGSRTRVQATLSLEQLYRNTFSQKAKPLGVLKREKESNPLCITITLLFLNTFINYIRSNLPFFHVSSSSLSFLRTSQAAVTCRLLD